MSSRDHGQGNLNVAFRIPSNDGPRLGEGNPGGSPFSVNMTRAIVITQPSPDPWAFAETCVQAAQGLPAQVNQTRDEVQAKSRVVPRRGARRRRPGGASATMGRMSSLTFLPQHSAGLPAPLARQAGCIEALYVHVPFCASKCHYCDFYSVAGHLDQSGAFLEALAREIDLHLSFFGTPRPRTVFVGGGTPTLLPARVAAAFGTSPRPL